MGYYDTRNEAGESVSSLVKIYRVSKLKKNLN
ncbi:hypothetical protein Dub35A_019 [Lactococcus phage Dub35A]|nr:hypothetical protein Dub35A_019 [Lactococcus phage Dub35A]